MKIIYGLLYCVGSYRIGYNCLVLDNFVYNPWGKLYYFRRSDGNVWVTYNVYDLISWENELVGFTHNYNYNYSNDFTGGELLGLFNLLFFSIFTLSAFNLELSSLGLFILELDFDNININFDFIISMYNWSVNTVDLYNFGVFVITTSFFSTPVLLNDSSSNSNSSSSNIKVNTEINELPFLLVLKDIRLFDLEEAMMGKLYAISSLQSWVESTFSKMTLINEKGYINNTDINDIYILNYLHKEYLQVSDSKFTFKNLPANEQLALMEWTAQLVIFNLYQLLLLLRELLINNKESSEYYNDLVVRNETLHDNIKGLLNQNIKHHLKSSVKINANTFVGFDTEYDQLDSKFNKLVSIQLKATNQVVVSVPNIVREFSFSSYNIGSNEYYILRKRDLNTDLLEYETVKVDWFALKSMFTLGLNYVNNFNESYWNYLTIIHTNFINYNKFYNDGIQVVKDEFYTHYLTYKGDNQMLMEEIFKLTEEYTFKELFEDVINMNNNLLNKTVGVDDLLPLQNLKSFIENVVPLDFTLNSNSNSIEKYDFSAGLKIQKYKHLNEVSLINEPGVRVRIREVLNISLKRNIYIAAHFNVADLSMLNDFTEYADSLSLVGNTFATMQPIRYKDYNIHIRDTMTLTPAGMQSLKAIGDILNLPKLEVGSNNITKMGEYSITSPVEFKAYAMRDAEIVLLYMLQIQESAFKIKYLTMPISLSGMAKYYMRDYWNKNQYSGYQIPNTTDLMVNQQRLQTPKNIQLGGLPVIKLSLFIASYKGGRNESFMYGYEASRDTWYDWDLTSCYSTIMYFLHDLDYSNTTALDQRVINKLNNNKDLTKTECNTFGNRSFYLDGIYKNIINDNNLSLNSTLDEITFMELLFNYYSFRVDFEFPEHVKYPSIAVLATESDYIYPLTGKGIIITGLEYILALHQGCVIRILEGVKIPLKIRSQDREVELQITEIVKQIGLYNKEIKRLQRINNENKLSIEEVFANEEEIKSLQNKIKACETKVIKINLQYKDIFRPFGFMNDLQIERRKHPKKSFLNLLQKMYGNGAYGKVAQGIGNNDKFSIQANATVRMEGSEYSNQILSAYITGLARSVLGEVIHNVSFIKGAKVVSCTTDGLLTNVPDLEETILKLSKENKDVKVTFLNLYRFLRSLLTEGTDPRALELKLDTTNTKMFSWSVRGQFSSNEEGNKAIIAMTGMQRKATFMKNYTKIGEMLEIMFDSKDKKVIYVQSSLRSGIDIIKHGGQVTGKYMDKSFTLLYNNKRFIIDIADNGVLLKPQGKLLDSKPLNRLEEFLLLKMKKDLVRVEKHINDKVYNREINKMRSKYTEYIDLGLRRFITKVQEKGLDKTYFKNNNKQIVEFIESYNSQIKEFNYDKDKKEIVYKKVNVTPRLVSDLKYRNKISKFLPKGIIELDNFIKFIVDKAYNEGLDITLKDFDD